MEGYNSELWLLRWRLFRVHLYRVTITS